MATNNIPFIQGGSGSEMYPNPFFDYLSRLMPRNIKDMFTWLEYLFANSGQVYPVIKKFAEYAITDISYSSPSPKIEANATKVFEDIMQLKATLINISNDFHLYGNSFLSIYRPFIRNLVCTKCNKTHNVEKTPYKWNTSKFAYEIKCMKCGYKGIAKVKNTKLRNINRLRVIRWDPKHIDIEFNPVTGESQYYYNFPDHIKREVKKAKPSPFILDRMPWEYIQAMKAKKLFKFNTNKIFHLKNPSPAGVSQEWGFPGLLCALKPYFYTAVLKKANEATAFERLKPWRILYPEGNNQLANPATMINLGKWKSELQTAIKTWRRDPDTVKISPVPVGMQQIGGDGRALLLNNEIKMEEENTITSMGVPLEFVRGGLGQSNGTVTLRMLENTLLTYTSQLKTALQWITDEVNGYMNYEKITATMVPFKVIDDVQQKQLLLQLWEAQKVSDTTATKFFDIDFAKEREIIESDTAQNAKSEERMNRIYEDIQNSIATQIRQQAMGDPLSYDPMAVYQVAEEQAMSLTQMPADQRKQELQAMEQTDPVLHALVQKLVRSIFSSQQSEGVGAMAPEPPM